MFHNTLTELGLFGCREAGAAKPSYRPAVEALEERLALASNAVDFGFGNAIAGALNQALGQLGNHPSPKMVEQAAKTLANRGLGIAQQVEKGTISFAEANRQIIALHKTFVKLQAQPAAHNSRFRNVFEDFKIFKEYVQFEDIRGGGSQRTSLKEFIIRQHPFLPGLKQVIRAIEAGTPFDPR